MRRMDFPSVMRSARILWVLVWLEAAFVVQAAESLTQTEVERVIAQASQQAVKRAPHSVLAVVDRDGRALAVWSVDGSAPSGAQIATAVSKAGTAVFLSSNEHAFSSRTAGFIIQQNFPPRVRNRPPGPLVGVGFSNLAFSDVNYFRSATSPEARIPGTRLYGSPGGVPLYKNGVLVGGVGATGDGTEQEDATIVDGDIDEEVALAGQVGLAPSAVIWGSQVFIDGIRVPYIGTPIPAVTSGGAATGVAAVNFSPRGLPAVIWPQAIAGGVFGEVRATPRGDPLSGTIRGQARLTEAEVRTIISRAAARAAITRAGIRLPAGRPAQVFITVVNNPDAAGVAPAVLGTFGTNDATIFSWDVSVQKARTAVFFSSDTRAHSVRTVGFLAQSLYPPGIINKPAGPYFGLQERFSIPLLSGTAGSNANLPNGITIFPGGFPLYRNGVLIGAIGVSGDGVDQDDLIAAAGTEGLQPVESIRADQQFYLGIRLPYAKFPRDAELRPGVTPTLPTGFANLAAEGPPGALLNLSARGYAAGGGDNLILGFVTETTEARSWLLRGVGPSLAGFGVSDSLAAPELSVYSGSNVIDNAGAWSGRSDTAVLRNAAAETGAFPLVEGSADAALIKSLPTGAYTVVVRGAGAGTALAEVYDGVGAQTAGALRNASIRGRVTSAEKPLVAGLVIGAGASRTVLVRGVGPGLAKYGVAQPLAGVTLQLVNEWGETIASGARWSDGSNVAEIEQATAKVGAFPFEKETTGDTALLVTLPGGNYTVMARPADGAGEVGGEMLLEVYVVD